MIDSFMYVLNLQRSFKKELFDDAAAIMEKHGIKGESQLNQFRTLGQRAYNIAIQNMRQETDFSDAPEEFRGTNYLTFITLRIIFLSFSLLILM